MAKRFVQQKRPTDGANVAAKRRKVMESCDKGYSEAQEVPFTHILYNRKFCERFAPNHILNKINKDYAGILTLAEDILSKNVGVEDPQDVALTRIIDMPDFINIIKKIISNYKRLSLKYLLNNFCKSNILSISATSPEKCYITADIIPTVMSYAYPECEDGQTQEILLQQEMQAIKSPAFETTSPLGWQQVFTVLVAVLRRIIPNEVWGSSHNFCIMKRAVKKILMLGRHDKFYLGFLMKNIKTKDCRWATSLRSFSVITNLVAKVYLWIMTQIVFATLRGSFYITEHASCRNQLLYYRKCVWQKQHDYALSAMVNSGSLEKLSQEKAVTYSHLTAKKGSIPRIRFIPKMQNARPIVPLRKGGMPPSLLYQARIFLNELSKGCKKGSFKAKNAYELQNAWHMYTKKLMATKFTKPLYFVRADVQDAYGSILHSKLFELLKNCVDNLAPKLMLGQYALMLDTGKVSKKTVYILLDDKRQPTRSLVNGEERLVEIGSPIIVQPQKIFNAIKNLVSNQVITNGSLLLRVARGVPQGGTLSAALCEFYYASMCANHFSKYNIGTNMLLRAVDDFLFISQSRDEAKRVLEQTVCGVPDFNCHMNREKTFHNIDNQIVFRVPFCGVIVCLKSLQLLVHASGLANGYPRYSMRLNKFKAPGDFVKLRLQQVTLARLKPLVLDPSYTKCSGLIANVWRSGIMAGARLITLLHCVLSPRGPVNTKFVACMVIKVGYKVCRQVKSVFKRGNVNLTIPDEVILITYVGGVCTMMKWPSLPKWPSIHTNLKKFLKRMLVRVPSNMQMLLPTIPQTT
ncbi:telomerase reverse transcriptase isoform X2 [Procambarus clarkii]|uniref:telomerase reverse transcriptase isoform X2 n=1 Tax=Procambarus clarkii TaxID=6728 RepID=UPI001E67128C|nr:telomerase reverse transcriptase-like isoform X2 [Procambarus clarkii]